MIDALTAAAGALALALPLSPQMEKRDRALFEPKAFDQQAPALGALAPDLCLERLDGRPWSLAQELGKSIVLVKASFT